MDQYAASRAMEQMEIIDSQSDLALKRKIKWRRYKVGSLWKFAFGPYRIFKWMAHDVPQFSAHYVEDGAETTLTGGNPVGDRETCKRRILDHALLMRARRTRIEAERAAAADPIQSPTTREVPR